MSILIKLSTTLRDLVPGYDPETGLQVLLDEGETPAPEREPDYRLTLAGDGGAESEYELWIEEESIVWRVPDGGAAHLSPASPEALREYLDGVQE